MASPTVPAPSPFQLNHQDRTLAAYFLVGVVRIAMAYLNLGEVQKAQNLLQGALLEYELAEQKLAEVNPFLNKSTTKEMETNGNRSNS